MSSPHLLNKVTRWLSDCCLLLTAFCVLANSPTVSAQVPSLIRYQGQAVDSNGVPLEGPYTLTFRLYNAETAGAKLWEEAHANVPVSGGYFSVLLGESTSLNAMDWGIACWLSVQVNTEPELAPRQRISSVPLAIRAETAEIVKTSGLTDDVNRLVPTGTIIMWSGASCPAGYSRMASVDGALLKAGASFSLPTTAGTADLPAHAHSFSAATSTDGTHKHNLIVEKDTGGETALISSLPNTPMADGTRYEDWAGSHSHTVSGTTAAVGSAKVATLVLCQKD